MKSFEIDFPFGARGTLQGFFDHLRRAEKLSRTEREPQQYEVGGNRRSELAGDVSGIDGVVAGGVGLVAEQPAVFFQEVSVEFRAIGV